MSPRFIFMALQLLISSTIWAQNSASSVIKVPNASRSDRPDSPNPIKLPQSRGDVLTIPLKSATLKLNRKSVDSESESLQLKSSKDFGNSVQMGNANGGGGGDVVIFPLGDPHIADTYSKVDVYHDREITFSSQLQERLGDLNLLRKFYLVRAQDDTLNINDFRSAFYAVDELPDNPICNRRLKYNNIPDNAYVEQVACTIGSETWILMSIFERMSIDDQALLVFHEDLRRNRDIDDVTIATVINGMMVAVKNLHLQEKSSDIQTLSDKDLTMIRRMFRSLQFAYGTSPAQARQIVKEHILTPHGGIFHGNAEQFEKLASGVTLGIGTYLENGSDVGENSILVNTNICRKSCTVGSNTIIKTAYGLELIQDSEINRYGTYWELTRTNNKSTIRIGSGVVINNAKFLLTRKILTSYGVYQYESPSFVIGEGAHVTGWTILVFPGQKFEIGANAKLNALNIQQTLVDIVIEPSSEISDLNIKKVETQYPVNLSGSILGDKNYWCKNLNRDANGTSPKGLSKLIGVTGSVKMSSIKDVVRNCSNM